MYSSWASFGNPYKEWREEKQEEKDKEKQKEEVIARRNRQARCRHEFETISNFYGDYIDHIANNPKKIYRSRVRCKKCGKEKLSEYLDKNCTVTNDGKCT